MLYLNERKQVYNNRNDMTSCFQIFCAENIHITITYILLDYPHSLPQHSNPIYLFFALLCASTCLCYNDYEMKKYLFRKFQKLHNILYRYSYHFTIRRPWAETIIKTMHGLFANKIQLTCFALYICIHLYNYDKSVQAIGFLSLIQHLQSFHVHTRVLIRKKTMHDV